MPRRSKEPEPEPVDSTGWILDNPYAEFVLMNQAEIVSSCSPLFSVTIDSMATVGYVLPCTNILAAATLPRIKQKYMCMLGYTYMHGKS